MSRIQISRHAFIPLAAIAVGVLVLAPGGCPPNVPNPDPNQTSTSFTLGDATAVLGTTVGAAGGTIKVENTGSPLDGLEITVPAGAYPDDRTFNISYQPVISHGLGTDVQVLTPLIIIDNGGGYADDIIEMKVPVQTPAGHFAMGFFYDPATGELEGIPDVDRDAGSITIATRHFSDVCFTSMAIDLLFGVIDTGFQVGVDNWPFANPPNYLVPGGTCSGMAVSALYYFDKLKATEGPLYTRYNNNGSPNPATVLGEDDVHAIQLCSTAQWYETNFKNQEYWYWVRLASQKSQLWTFYKFALSMQLTNKPQYVAILPDSGPGHALVVYKKEGQNKLYVADSNFPADSDAHISFDLDTEKMSYTSKNNAVTTDVSYTRMWYLGRTAIVDWNDLGELFGKINTDAIGADFPAYQIQVAEYGTGGAQTYSTVGSTYTAQTDTLKFRVQAAYDYTLIPCDGTETYPLYPAAAPGPITIHPADGDMLLGLAVYAERESPDPNDTTKQIKSWAWAGFQWITISYTDPSACVSGTYDRWLFEWDTNCDDTYTSDNLWHLQADGTVADHWTGVISGYTWHVEYRSGVRMLVVIPGPEFHWVAKLSDDCNNATDGVVEWQPGYSGNHDCFRAKRY